MVAIVFLVPIISTIIATIGFIFVLIGFRAKPWKMKFWLLMTTFSFIPWAGLTIFMRTANTHDQALWLLRGSFISLQISFYSAYRFHHLMTYSSTDNRLSTFGLAALTGFNIALAIDTANLDTVRDASNQYYVDLFGSSLMVTNVILGAWSGYFVFSALDEMDAFALFYDKKGLRNTVPIFLFLTIIGISFSALIIWIIQNRSKDSTPFMIIMDLAIIFFGYTYGINPTSKILAPQRLWSFMIIDQNGLLIYEHDFSHDQTIGVLPLLAMGVMATNSTIKMHLNSPSPVDEVSMEDRTILVKERLGLLFCLVADHSSIQLQIELIELTNRIINHKKFRIPRLGEEYGVFDYSNRLLAEVFGSKMGTRKG